MPFFNWKRNKSKTPEQERLAEGSSSSEPKATNDSESKSADFPKTSSKYGKKTLGAMAVTAAVGGGLFTTYGIPFLATAIPALFGAATLSTVSAGTLGIAPSIIAAGGLAYWAKRHYDFHYSSKSTFSNSELKNTKKFESKYGKDASSLKGLGTFISKEPTIRQNNDKQFERLKSIDATMGTSVVNDLKFIANHKFSNDLNIKLFTGDKADKLWNKIKPKFMRKAPVKSPFEEISSSNIEKIKDKYFDMSKDFAGKSSSKAAICDKLAESAGEVLKALNLSEMDKAVKRELIKELKDSTSELSKQLEPTPEIKKSLEEGLKKNTFGFNEITNELPGEFLETFKASVEKHVENNLPSFNLSDTDRVNYDNKACDKLNSNIENFNVGQSLIKSLEQQVEQGDNLKEQKAGLAAKDAKLAEKDTELEAKDAELAEKDTELEAKDTELATQDETLAKQQAKIEAQKAELEARKARIAELEASVRAPRPVPASSDRSSQPHNAQPAFQARPAYTQAPAGGASQRRNTAYFNAVPRGNETTESPVKNYAKEKLFEKLNSLEAFRDKPHQVNIFAKNPQQQLTGKMTFDDVRAILKAFNEIKMPAGFTDKQKAEAKSAITNILTSEMLKQSRNPSRNRDARSQEM